MKGSSIFPSKSLKAEDLQGQEPIVTIDKVTTQAFDDGSRKPVIHFSGKDKTLVCNKTNWNAIVEITGEDDSDNWGGQRIKLVTARVDFQGKRVNAIRVEPPTSAAKQAVRQRVDELVNKGTKPSQDDLVAAPSDDDIPF